MILKIKRVVYYSSENENSHLASFSNLSSWTKELKKKLEYVNLLVILTLIIN